MAPQGTGHSKDRRKGKWLPAVDHRDWRREVASTLGRTAGCLVIVQWIVLLPEMEPFSDCSGLNTLVPLSSWVPPTYYFPGLSRYLTLPALLCDQMSVESLKGLCLELTVLQAVFEARLLLHQVDKMADLAHLTINRFHSRDSKINSLLRSVHSSRV